MVVVDSVASALREIEPQLLQPTKNAQAAFGLEDHIRAVRKLIAELGDLWISVADATRYLAVDSEKYVTYHAQVGQLRSRTLPDGTIELSLDSVLRDRENYEAMTAMDKGEPISTEELMYLLRPNTYPRPAGFMEPRKPTDSAW